jgi:hypothetical protein
MFVNTRLEAGGQVLAVVSVVLGLIHLAVASVMAMRLAPARCGTVACVVVGLGAAGIALGVNVVVAAAFIVSWTALSVLT